MDKGKLPNEENLPVDVSELGELKSAKQECPGVYYLRMKAEDSLGLLPREYYLVLENAPISEEARNYGKPLQNGQGLVFGLGQEKSGDKVIEYEIYRYKVSHHLSLPEGENLHGCAVYGAEIYPEYFGMLPVPALTPWGYTTRYRVLDSGIYWIETDQCKEVLAVAHPAWAADLSKSVLRHGRQLAYDTEHGINHTLGYKFFSKRISCIVIFELLQTRPKWLTNGNILLPELMNAILVSYPEYAMSFNAHEQAGLNDGVGMFLQSMGVDVELKKSEENMIKLNPDVGVDFLRWP